MNQKEHVAIIEKHIGGKVIDFIVISSGLTCMIYIHEGMVYRFDMNKKSMKEEVEILNFLNNKVPISIPNPIQISEGGMKYKLLEGQTMHSLGLEWNEELLFQISEFLHALHGIPLGEFPYAYEQDNYLSSNKAEMLTKLQKRLPKYLSQEQQRKVYTYFDSLIKYGGSDLVVIHGDLNTKNVLIKDGNISGIIDFSDCRIESRALDFGQFGNESPLALKQLIKVYDGFHNKKFFDECWTLAKRFILFDILNDWVYENDDGYIDMQLKKFGFK